MLEDGEIDYDSNLTFILLSRSLLESEVFASEKLLKIWIWCLCRANWKTKYISIKKGKGEDTVKLERGQFLFGRFKAEEQLDISGSTIYKLMKKLEKMGNISIESSSHFSIITICNYDTYQDVKTYKKQHCDSTGTALEQHSNSTGTTLEPHSDTDNTLNTLKASNTSNTLKDSPSTEVEDESMFEKFWSKYPVKKGKSQALTTWKRFKCDNKFDLIMERLSQFKECDDWKDEGGKFIPHGSTWMSKKRWEDEPELFPKDTKQPANPINGLAYSEDYRTSFQKQLEGLKVETYENDK